MGEVSRLLNAGDGDAETRVLGADWLGRTQLRQVSLVTAHLGSVPSDF